MVEGGGFIHAVHSTTQLIDQKEQHLPLLIFDSRRRF
jgi:hypothetical protein